MAQAEDRTNKATIKDTSLTDAFRQGFEEGVALAATTQTLYEVEASFEGTMLRKTQFSDLGQALAEVKEFLSNGSGTEINIKVIAVALDAEGAALAAAPDDDDVVDAEIVEEPPS